MNILATLYLTLNLNDKFEEKDSEIWYTRCYFTIEKIILRWILMILKLLNEDTQNLKQMTTKKGWLSGYFGTSDFTSKNKLTYGYVKSQFYKW